ncbi:MAG: undecaprenyl-diphosphate phosphatase [Flavobacteriales bacterium]|nr:undecaprenyl-diphosphate phosphatase [Flavobacteriales bacterium]
MGLIEAVILAIIEGITEYIPVSSTGHMIIASSFLGIQSEDFVKLFTVCIQLGAILAVVVLYWKRFFRSLSFYYKLFVAFIPAVIIGLLFKDLIDAMLENVLVVAISLITGGVVLVFIDQLFNKGTIDSEDDTSYSSALVIGIFQTISMIPGVSRSAATIIGGMARGLTRKAAAEFSFFLAVPTMFAATSKSLFDYYQEGMSLSNEEWKLLGIGNLIAFIVSVIAIRFMIRILTKYGFKYFGYYRILAGAIIIVLYFSGVQLNIID